MNGGVYNITPLERQIRFSGTTFKIGEEYERSVKKDQTTRSGEEFRG
jgi:hypothetical protein